MESGSSVPPVDDPAAPAISVISPQFCVNHPVDLTVVRKLMSWSGGDFGVTDVNGNIMFSVKGNPMSFRDRRVLLDSAGNPLITFHQKLFSAHNRWQVFRGESTDLKDLIFNVKMASYLQVKTKLLIYLTSNTSEDVCDFKIEGSWFERSCVIYAGDSSDIIAQMHKKHTAESVLLGKDTFGVTVNPHVDCAFIVALVVILEEINDDKASVF